MHRTTAIFGFGLVVWQSICTSVVCGQGLAALEEQAIQAAVRHVAPSVVRVETVGAIERVADVQSGLGASTGLIVAEDGWIVTSDFGFATPPESILVTVPDKGRLQAKLVATDFSRRLVLLKVEASELPVPLPAPDEEIRVGQWAIALGRSYDAELPGVSVGVVSAVDRLWGKTIQTDAKISPNNYGGPLIDIRGRVLGVLSALGPEMMSGGGADLYDSGIGFAVPFSHVLQVLPRWQQGDLRAGVLGINFRGKDMFAEPAVIGAARAGGPGAKSGLKKGDTIVAAGGKPVTRQAEFKQIIGPLYAGDRLAITVARGRSDNLDLSAELVAELPPYVFPFIGILVNQSARAEKGVAVRYVFADSAAAQAGLQPGDVITALNQAKLSKWSELNEALIDYLPGDEVQLEFLRDGKQQSAKLALQPLTATPPESLTFLPMPQPAEEEPAAEKPADDFDTLKLAEFPNEALLHVPPTYKADQPHGLILCFFPPSDFLPERSVSQWKQACADARLLMIAPKPQQASEWQLSELAFARKVLEQITKSHKIDANRIAVYGAEAGGAMAYAAAFGFHDMVRGVAVVDAPLPAAVNLPETNPVERLLVWSSQVSVAGTAQTPLMRQINAGLARLEKMRYPTYVNRHTGGNRELDAKSFQLLVKWFDSLDRL